MQPPAPLGHSWTLLGVAKLLHSNLCTAQSSQGKSMPQLPWGGTWLKPAQKCLHNRPQLRSTARCSPGISSLKAVCHQPSSCSVKPQLALPACTQWPERRGSSWALSSCIHPACSHSMQCSTELHCSVTFNVQSCSCAISPLPPCTQACATSEFQTPSTGSKTSSDAPRLPSFLCHLTLLTHMSPFWAEFHYPLLFQRDKHTGGCCWLQGSGV